MKDGYQYAGVPPNASLISMANGQQPTKPDGAGPLEANGADFQTPTNTTRRVARTADGRHQ